MSCLQDTKWLFIKKAFVALKKGDIMGKGKIVS